MHDDDKRSDRRVPVRTSATIELDGRRVSGACSDLSAHGVLLILPERLNVGTHFDVVVKAAGGGIADLRATGMVVTNMDVSSSMCHNLTIYMTRMPGLAPSCGFKI
jgi:hypothetical protein